MAELQPAVITHVLRAICACALFATASAAAGQIPPMSDIWEKSFVSGKHYDDPFNDVDVDVIFSDGKTEWRVPAFWRGGDTWTVRFSPPRPGSYGYRLVSTDAANSSLNNLRGTATIVPYTGS